MPLTPETHSEQSNIKCDSHLLCLSQIACVRMSHSRIVPLLLLYTNKWHAVGWNSAAVMTSVNSSMFAGFISTMSVDTDGQGNISKPQQNHSKHNNNDSIQAAQVENNRPGLWLRLPQNILPNISWPKMQREILQSQDLHRAPIHIAHIPILFTKMTPQFTRQTSQSSM